MGGQRAKIFVEQQMMNAIKIYAQHRKNTFANRLKPRSAFELHGQYTFEVAMLYRGLVLSLVLSCLAIAAEHDKQKRQSERVGTLQIQLSKVLGDNEPFYTSAITGKKIRRADIDVLANLEYSELVKAIENMGIDIAFVNIQNERGDALRITRKNTSFSKEELEQINQYAEGVTSALLRHSGRTTSTSHSIEVGGLALGQWEHLQTEREGMYFLVRRRRPERPLLILNSQDEGRLRNSTLHELLHTRFYHLEPIQQDRTGEKWGMHDGLVKAKFDLEKKFSEAAKRVGITSTGKGVSTAELEKDPVALKHFFAAYLDYMTAILNLEATRAVDEFDVLSVQIDTRDKFGYSDKQMSSYLRYMLDNINHGRAICNGIIGNRIIQWGLQKNLGIGISDKYSKILSLRRDFSRLFDRAEYFARQDKFKKFVPELEEFPPGYSEVSYR